MKRMAFKCRQLPRSLFGRLMMIMIPGLVVTHLLSLYLAFYEHTQSSSGLTIRDFGKDAASPVAVLAQRSDHKRASPLEHPDRWNASHVLGISAPVSTVGSHIKQRTVDASTGVSGSNHRMEAGLLQDGNDHPSTYLQLRDGTPFTLEFALSPALLSSWVFSILCLQLLLLVLTGWLAAKWVARPLAMLAEAADKFGTDFTPCPLSENGSAEAARTIRAFNLMQRRIGDHLTERMQTLAGISHDLQTSITRMRLRADLLEDQELREKLIESLISMQMLVEGSIAYARDGHGIMEADCRVDLDALLDSLVHDYVCDGHELKFSGGVGEPIITRPNTLRRIVINLIENALKFGSDAEVLVGSDATGVSIHIMDRGPGIPESELQSVMRPFYRIDDSRNRETGGSGLGLAIARQLVLALGGTLMLANRDCGGLQATIFLPNAVLGGRQVQKENCISTNAVRLRLSAPK